MKNSFTIPSQFTAVALLSVLLASSADNVQAAEKQFRPPAVPLVTSDPYLSIWSESDSLAGSTTVHWTRREQALASLIRVDGDTFRLMGRNPTNVTAMAQVGLEVTPTRSIYQFEDARVHVTLTFMTPALPNDLDAMAMPLSYLTWQVRSVDGKEHSVSIFDSTSSQVAVNKSNEKVTWERVATDHLTVLKAGTQAQPILKSSGDDHQINWGYVCAAAPTKDSKSAMGSSRQLLEEFVSKGQLPATDDTRMPRAANDEQPVLAFVFDLGKVSAKAVSCQAIVAYDEVYAIKYFGQKLQPYWRRNGESLTGLFEKASKHYSKLAARCVEFDTQLMADAKTAGGEKYAQICALAYRECAAACGLAADANGQPLFFTKENTSNGDIATVDVFFPMAPQWMLLSPTLAKASVVPILSYAASWHWKFPNAPHDLGTYPIANGTDDGGEGMPVEESGNMLILCDAIAHADGNANFVSPWWPKLTEWALYLEQYGLDPENQLCTDDFMGHLAHNANLSIKAILGLAAYGDLCQMRGDKVNAEKYKALAIADAKHWLKAAGEDGHYKLAFDKPNSWSQKYNLVWDQILGLNIFPPDVARAEVAHYKKVMQRYGVPLDSRTKLTKTDWSFWSATLADNQADFESFISPVYDYLNTTTARSPLVDSYITDDIHSDGMHARPVVGGLFVKMLSDHAMWMKWARADKQKVGNWALLPESPKVTEYVATSQKTPAVWRYSFAKPAADWTQCAFDASAWKEGPAGFGTSGTPGAVVHTTWNTGDIWLRREITLPAGPLPRNLQFLAYHDEDVEIYVNGVPAASESGFVASYSTMEIEPAALALFKPGEKITLAVHCHQTTGGQDIDVGLVSVEEAVPGKKR